MRDNDPTPPIDILPPSYDPNSADIDSELCHSPTYSAYPTDTEISLLAEASESSPSPTPQTVSSHDWYFETKHMKIHFAPQIWKSTFPTYGLNSSIDGSVNLLSAKECVDKVTAELGMDFSSCVPTKYGSYTVTFRLKTITLYDAATGSPWADDIEFSIAVPSTVIVGGEETPAPPSFYCANFAASCQVAYSFKITLSKKGSALFKQESKTIPIFYLPKNAPDSPPLTNIPRPASLHSVAVSPTYLHMFDRIQTKTLSPFWPSTCSKQAAGAELSGFQHCINFSLPTPKCFTSGEVIPYAVSVTCPDQPTLPPLLVHHIRASLIKRVSIITSHKKDHSSNQDTGQVTRVHGEWPVATGHLKYQNEYAEGLVLYRGFITAGSAGKECSFTLPDLLEVQYILRLTVTPPKYLQEHVPSFHHDELIEIKTDHWGAVERELVATGGMPTPALGLMNCSSPDEEYVSRWGWPV